MIAQLTGLDMHYAAIGAGVPILMLHGGYCDHLHMMAEMEPSFDGLDGWQRIYPDLTGHGRTAAPAGMTNHDQILDAVMAFAETVLPRQRFAVAGMSAGGHLARGLVAKCPDRLLGVMLRVPAIETDYAKRRLPEPIIISEMAGLDEVAGTRATALWRMFSVIDAAAIAWDRDVFFPARQRHDQSFGVVIWSPENYRFGFELGPQVPFEGRH
jgi:pimeloyl-ACP methyl ester carboxylesterase